MTHSSIKMRLVEGDSTSTQIFALDIPEKISPNDPVIQRARELVQATGRRDLPEVFEQALRQRS